MERNDSTKQGKIIDNKLCGDLSGLVKVEAICAASTTSLPLPASQKIY